MTFHFLQSYRMAQRRAVSGAETVGLNCYHLGQPLRNNDAKSTFMKST